MKQVYKKMKSLGSSPLRWLLFILALGIGQTEARPYPVNTTLQKKQITGKVTDRQGEALVGVTVMVKDRPQIGTTTDENGIYELNVPDKSILVFRYVGYLNQEVSLTDHSTVDVVLEEDPASLEEVVIVGFGTQKKESVIGAITTINPSELKVPSSNLTTALAGRMAGVIAYQRSGEPGQDNADFFIRGVTTFGYKVDPLILIDNIEVTSTDLARLQVDDIASFSIMKDATATAIYGARGANGVILITTKEGKEGAAKLSIRLESSLSAPTKDIELVDPITYMKLHNQSVLTRDPLGNTYYSRERIENTSKGVNPVAFPATDWKTMLIKNYTNNERLNLSVNGGGKAARYFVSGAFNQDNGILKVDNRNNFNSNIDLKTYSLRSNVNIDLTRTTELLVRLNGSFDDYTGPIDGGAKVYRDIMRTNPVLFPPFYEPNAEQSYIRHILFGNVDNGDVESGKNVEGYINPYANMVSGYKNYSRSMMLAQLELKQDLDFFVKGLKFRSMANTIRNSFFDVKRKYNPFFYNLTGYDDVMDSYRLSLINEETGTEYLDYSEGQKTVSSVFYMENALSYDRTFMDKHIISGLLVNILSQRIDANAGNLQRSLPFRNIGLSGRFTYAFDSRYFGEFNFGYNGSERFHESNRFGFFPSAGLAWSVSNEKFWQPIKDVVNNLKIRATYGMVGNDAIGSSEDRFFYLSNVNMNSSAHGVSFGIDNDYSRNGINITRYSNPDITWEKAKKTNLALEMGLFNKMEIIADVFHEHRTNILMTRASIPVTMGLGVPVRANVGEAMGKGLDLSLNYSHSFNKGLWIQSRANFTYATSEFKVYEEPQYEDKHLSRVGYSLSQQWGYIGERLFVDEEEVRNSPRQNFGTYMAGDIKYRDVNDDGQITTLDRVPIGYPTTPEIVYGFGLSMGMKNLDFSFFFQGLGRESFWIDAGATSPFGRYQYDNESFSNNTILQNQMIKSYADDHWSEDNRNLYALWPRLSDERVNNNEVRSTYFMRDGTFLRLKQVELGYSFPQKVKEKINSSNLRMYLTATNLLTWSRFKLWDVEMAGNGLGYPVQRVFNVGLQMSF